MLSFSGAFAAFAQSPAIAQVETGVGEERPASDPAYAALPASTEERPESVFGPHSLSIATVPTIRIGQDEMRLSGASHVEQLLNVLPQFVANRTSFLNTGGNGTVNLDLHGLGSSRTLVLVDGRRWIPNNAFEQTDLNTIPAFMVESIETHSGGGSTLFGAGAVAGVVNFRLRKLEGPLAGATVALTDEGDGRQSTAHLGYGSSFGAGRGQFTAFAEYLHRSPLRGSARELGRFLFIDDGSGTDLVQSGSTAVPEGAFGDWLSGEATNYDFFAIFSEPGTSRPFDFEADLYNFQPENYLQAPHERWLAGGRLEYEIAPTFNAYIEGEVVNNRVVHQQAPSNFTSVLLGFTEIDLAAVAPYLSAADLAQLTLISQRQSEFGFVPEGSLLLDVRYRTVQAGPRRYINDRDSWRILAGMSGNLTDSIIYDISFQNAQTKGRETATGAISTLHFNELIGNGTCNVFGAGLLSDACLAQIVVDREDRESSRSQIARATVASEAFALPWANRNVEFLLGAEWRSRKYYPSDAIGILQSSGYDTTELFGAVQAPVFDWLDLAGGARFTDFSLPGADTAWSWFAGAELAPANGLKLRVRRERAVRAPDIYELFRQQSEAFDFATDPCSALLGATDQQLAELCVDTGVPSGLVFSWDLDPFPFFESRTGGNPELAEEKTNIWTFGIELRPALLPGLSVSSSYYDIDITGAPLTFSAQDMIDACYFFERRANGAFCGAIERDSNFGTINFVDVTLRNAGALRSRGVDFQIQYERMIDFSISGSGSSQLRLDLVGNWTRNFDVIGVPNGGMTAEEWSMNDIGLRTPNVACAGRFGNGLSGDSAYRTRQFESCGEPKPHWSWMTRLSWIDGPITTSIRWRHKGPVRDDYDNEIYFENLYSVERISSYNLIDIAWAFDIDHRLAFTFGVNNLFDRDPPFVGSNGDIGINSWPGTYDILGRYFFAATELRF